MIGVPRDRDRLSEPVFMTAAMYLAIAIAALAGIAAAVFSCSGTDAALEAWRKL